jgi:hypothetical protein
VVTDHASSCALTPAGEDIQSGSRSRPRARGGGWPLPALGLAGFARGRTGGGRGTLVQDFLRGGRESRSHGNTAKFFGGVVVSSGGGANRRRRTCVCRTCAKITISFLI